jgi:hypothetical protein
VGLIVQNHRRKESSPDASNTLIEALERREHIRTPIKGNAASQHPAETRSYRASDAPSNRK